VEVYVGKLNYVAAYKIILKDLQSQYPTPTAAQAEVFQWLSVAIQVNSGAAMTHDSHQRRALRRAIKAMPPLTDEEDAAIQAGIALDPDNPELTAEQMAKLRPFKEVSPELYASIKRSRGRPRVAAPRQAVTLRLSSQTIEHYKAKAGDNWRALMTERLETLKR
jgi:uncharacterized protein (DUF4415 family)